MIRFSRAGKPPAIELERLLTVDSTPRALPQPAFLPPWTPAAAAGARVAALTMPVIVGMNMSFLTYCAST